MPGNRGEEKTSVVWFYSLAAAVVLLDQFTKFLAVRFLAPQDSLPLLPSIFHLTFVRNRGIAFGLFNGHPSLLLILITASLAVLIYLGIKMKESPVLQRWAFALILGGALGNWIDRVCYGAVIDFLDFRVWPVFNFADTAISAGVGLYLLSFMKAEKK